MKPISEYSNVTDLRQIMENAQKRGRKDVYWEAFKRVCELEGQNQTDPLHRDFAQTLAAYEELLTLKNGRRTSASRTRQKLKNKGVIQCLEDWALQPNPTDGFALLIKNNLFELTGEYLVTKYPEQFSEKAVAAARVRLDQLKEFKPEVDAIFAGDK